MILQFSVVVRVDLLQPPAVKNVHNLRTHDQIHVLLNEMINPSVIRCMNPCYLNKWSGIKWQSVIINTNYCTNDKSAHLSIRSSSSLAFCSASSCTKASIGGIASGPEAMWKCHTKCHVPVPSWNWNYASASFHWHSGKLWYTNVLEIP